MALVLCQNLNSALNDILKKSYSKVEVHCSVKMVSFQDFWEFRKKCSTLKGCSIQTTQPRVNLEISYIKANKMTNTLPKIFPKMLPTYYLKNPEILALFPAGSGGALLWLCYWRARTVNCCWVGSTGWGRPCWASVRTKPSVYMATSWEQEVTR